VERRGSGILLHVTSLPSVFGIGDLGPEAYSFIDFLKETHQSYWQFLPLNRTCIEYGNSPYSSYSAFAGNPVLISPEIMVKDGFLSKTEITNYPQFPKQRVDYRKVTEYKGKLWNQVFEKNKKRLSKNFEFLKFCRENAGWLDDYSLFIGVKKHFGGVDWGNWPSELRDREKHSITEWMKLLREEILKEKFLQYIFFKQWYSLKRYGEKNNIQIIGDMPIYVNYDSSDVWANPGIFSLDQGKKPANVAGVPPDYFSSTGQLWGHPVYNWEELKKTGYAWWIKRIEHNMKLFHLFRLDHFRGFVAYWRIRANEKTAINGEWVQAPARDFFNSLLRHFPHLPLIAEDLGIITSDVREVMHQFGFPGMKVLLFAFGGDLPTNPYAPHNHVRNCVVYTGTHDNNTAKGWFKKELGPEGKKRLSEYIGRNVTEKTVHWELVRLAMSSVADMIIIPMQDVLGLGEKARMNLPASTRGNWEWRLKSEQLSATLRKKLAEITAIDGRG
jgi:4-alpha-glucanotransferase